MADEKRIDFGAKDTGLSAFMKKVLEDGKRMYSTFADEAKKQLTSSKEQNKFIQERIRLLREELKVQMDIAREERTRARKNYEDVGKATKWNGGNIDFIEAGKRMAEAESRFNEVSGQQRGARMAGTYRQEEKGQNIFNPVVLAGVFRDMMGLARQLPNAQTGLDFVSPFAQIMGGVAGGGAGALIDAITGIKILGTGLGQTNLSGTSAQLGKDIAGIAADAVVRGTRIRDQYDRSYLGYTALGGKDKGMRLGNIGFADPAVAAAMMSVTQSSGTGVGAGKNSALMLALSRLGFADEGTSMAAFGMQRSGGGSGAQNMQRVLGIAFAEGLDKARFSDVIKTQTALLQHFAAQSTHVNSNDVNRTMFEFNRMGGMFSLGDPRALSNIMALSQGLSSPNNPFGQAQNYAVLRKLNPNADPWQLRTMEAKGLQTPGFLKGVIDQISSTGFSEPLQKFMLKGRFGELSNEAIDTLFANRGKIGGMSEGDLSKMMGLNKIIKDAEEHTSKLTKYEAEVTNAFKDDFLKGISTVADQFETEMGAAIRNVVSVLEDRYGSKKDNIGKATVVTSKDPAKNGKFKIDVGDGKSVYLTPYQYATMKGPN